MSDYHRSKIRAQELQAQKEAEVKREIAAKKEKDVAQAKEAEARRKRLDAAAAEARRKELMAANAALTTIAGHNAAARNVEYNPFAEDEYAPPTAGPSKKLAPGGGKLGSSTPNARAGPSQRSASGKAKERKEKDTTPPLLGRKERAARAFELQIKKQAKSNGLASIRDLVETDERGLSSPAPKPKPQQHRPHPQPLPVAPAPRKMVAPGKKGAGHLNEMRQLAPGREGWDRRSIDEIARDLRANRKPAPTGRTQSSEAAVPAKTNGTKRPRSTSPKPTKPRAKLPPIPSSARPVKSKRPRSPSTSSSSSSSTSPAPRHRLDLDEDDVAGVSATIQALFRRPGGAPRKYAASDASSDMEAGLSDVEEEEKRAARIARIEDARAEKEERERKEKKERMKRAAR